MNNEKNSAKKLNILLLSGMLSLYALFCFALVPISRTLSSDIAYSATVLPYIAEFVCDVCEISAISLGYATSVYIIYEFGVMAGKSSIFFFGGATLFKLAANLLISWNDEGFVSIDVKNDVWFGLLIPLALEIAQYFIVVRLAVGVFKRMASVDKKGAVESREVYPFTSMLDLGNPMIKTAFRAAIVVIVTKMLSRVVYDISLIAVSGAPRLSEIPLMIAYYISDAIPGVICYLAMLLTFMGIFSYKQKKNS